MTESVKQSMNALCFLPGFQWPLKVQVHGNYPASDNGKLERVLVTVEERYFRIIETHHKIPLVATVSVGNRIVLPARCILWPSPYTKRDDLKKSIEKIQGKSYHLIKVTNMENQDMVTWVADTYSQVELIPCTLCEAGQDCIDEMAFAFVSPINTPPTDYYRPYNSVPHVQLGKWNKVYKVHLHDIYRFEDINNCRRMVESTLAYVGHEVYPAGGGHAVGKCLGLHYRQLDEDASNLVVNRPNNSIYPDLNKQGVPLTKEVLGKDETEKEDRRFQETSLDGDNGTALNNEGDKKNMKLLPPGSSPKIPRKDTLRNKKLPSAGAPADDRHDIKDGTVAQMTRQYSREQKDNSTSNQRPERPDKIIVFGNCFAIDGGYSDERALEGIAKGDAVVASPDPERNIIGEIKMICRIPVAQQDTVFIGVVFEESLNVHPFEILHIWGKSDKCQHCKGMYRIFFPSDMLLNPDSPAKEFLRLLREPSSPERQPLMSTSDVPIDFDYEANRQDFTSTPLGFEQVTLGKLKNGGIEGRRNSCYIDAVLFALFSFTNKFDEGLMKPLAGPRNKDADDFKIKLKAAKNLLKRDIVAFLRNSIKVRWEIVYRFRLALSEVFNDKSYLGSFNDAENFITSLFSQVLQVPEFYQINEDNKDYVLQLFPPMTEEKMAQRPSVEYLLHEYFAINEVKLQEVPKCGLLLKLPVSNGVRQYNKILPNLQLNLGSILEGRDESAKCNMDLRAVICLEKNHFTCFVRIWKGVPGEKDTTWIFHDSLPGDKGNNILTKCPDLEEGLKLLSPAFNVPPVEVDMAALSDDAKKWVNILLSTAYICVYESDEQLLV